jgi:hypothetical protein
MDLIDYIYLNELGGRVKNATRDLSRIIWHSGLS